MDRNRNDVLDHPEWEFDVLPWRQAWLELLPCVSKFAIDKNRHNMKESDFFVFTRTTKLPINSDYWLELHPGFTTDWASVPPSLRFMLKHNSQDVRRASVTHDALYNHKSKYIGWKESNDIFKRIMIEDGSSKIKARLMHFGVSTSIGAKHWATSAEFDKENIQFSTIHKY